mgnify:CR=1 FL=1
MAYKVKRNNGTGAFGCYFEHRGKKYFAVVRVVSLMGGTECMIYPEDELDVIYGRRDVPATKEGLLSCIEEFVRMKEERA